MGGSPPSTTQLQALIDKGDDQAYGELLTLASSRLHTLARKMLREFPRLRRWEETDDVFQAAVLRLHQSLSEVRPSSAKDFLSLAATQIRRTLIDLARHHYGPEGPGAKHESDADNEQYCEADSPEKLAAWAEFHQQVEQLADQEREVFQLLWYAGSTQREAAELLGISERTVLRRYYRARLALKDSLPESNEQGLGNG